MWDHLSCAGRSQLVSTSGLFRPQACCLTPGTSRQREIKAHGYDSVVSINISQCQAVGTIVKNVGSSPIYELAFPLIQSCYQVPTTYKALNQVFGVIKRRRLSSCFEGLLLKYMSELWFSNFIRYQNHFEHCQNTVGFTIIVSVLINLI